MYIIRTILLTSPLTPFLTTPSLYPLLSLLPINVHYPNIKRTPPPYGTCPSLERCAHCLGKHRRGNLKESFPLLMYVIRTITLINVHYLNIRTFSHAQNPLKSNILPYIYLTYTIKSNLLPLSLHFFSTISHLKFSIFFSKISPIKKSLLFRRLLLPFVHCASVTTHYHSHYPFSFLPLVPK